MTSSTPNTPLNIKPKLLDQVKSSTPQFIVFDESQTNDEVIVDLLFENISSHELIQISRKDIINGQKIFYNPIKNLIDINNQFNPNNILALQDTSDQYFKKYPIKLDEKIPVVGNGPNGNNVYIDSSNNLIIETVNTSKDEQLEIQITKLLLSMKVVLQTLLQLSI